MNYSPILKNTPSLDQLCKENILPFFSDQSISFISKLAKLIRSDKELNTNTELQSLAFWMRTSHLKSLCKKYFITHHNTFRSATGNVFHIAPANVDSIFLYSWLLSLLTGNKNILRVSNKTRNRLSGLFSILDTLFSMPEYQAIAKRTMLISYDHNQDTTAQLTNKCDMRIIWGGDDTINTIRRTPPRPNAKELAFPNKFSLAIFNAEKIISNDIHKLVRNFYNDTYYFNQLACSSPRMIFWLGDSSAIDIAKKKFWYAFENFVLSKKPSNIEYSSIANKQLTTQSIAITNDVIIPRTQSNLVTRIDLCSTAIPESLHCGNGVFFEKNARNLANVFDTFQSHYQTVVCYGVTSTDIQHAWGENQPTASIRFVKPGEALNFSEVWDGYNLIYELSRIISINV